MVLLTITPSIQEDLHLRACQVAEESTGVSQDEPSLDHPTIGGPISHGQIIDLWKRLNAQGENGHSLEDLLKGSSVYIPPPAPKPELSREYKALMARLRRDEEERQYQRMISPAPPGEPFLERFSTTASLTHSFAEVHRPSREADLGDDDVTYNDVHRQMMLILNFMVSIIGVAGTLWVLARWWSTPARLFLTMGGSFLVGVAEVAVYSGYIWHLSEAKKNETKVKEIKEVVQSWAVGAGEGDEKEPVTVERVRRTSSLGPVRRRKKDSS